MPVSAAGRGRTRQQRSQNSAIEVSESATTSLRSFQADLALGMSASSYWAPHMILCNKPYRLYGIIISSLAFQDLYLSGRLVKTTEPTCNFTTSQAKDGMQVTFLTSGCV